MSSGTGLRPSLWSGDDDDDEMDYEQQRWNADYMTVTITDRDSQYIAVG